MADDTTRGSRGVTSIHSQVHARPLSSALSQAGISQTGSALGARWQSRGLSVPDAQPVAGDFDDEITAVEARSAIASEHDGFQRIASSVINIGEATETGRGNTASAQLQAFRFAHATQQSLVVEGARTRDTAKGKVVDGTVVVECAADLEALAGVVAVYGNLQIQETVARTADFLALSQLELVDGMLSVEGASATSALDAMVRLRSTRGVYVAFCDRMRRFLLPELREVLGAFVVEGCGACAEIVADRLETVQRAVELRDMASLRVFRARNLLSAPELILRGCPQLGAVEVGTRRRPATIRTLDLDAGAWFPTLFHTPA